MTINKLTTTDMVKALLHRYTITSEGAAKGYFRLVEDPEGAWVTWAEVDALLKRQTEQAEGQR